MKSLELKPPGTRWVTPGLLTGLLYLYLYLYIYLDAEQPKVYALSTELFK